jgi:hypothetical protein
LGRLVLYESAGFNRIEHVSERHQFSGPMPLYGGGAMLCHPENRRSRMPGYLTDSEAIELPGMYSSRQWRQTRAEQLRRHLDCAMCTAEGKRVRASVADHAKPHPGDPRLFFDPANLASLCQHHHDADKQRFEGLGYVTGVGFAGMSFQKSVSNLLI